VTGEEDGSACDLLEGGRTSQRDGRAGFCRRGGGIVSTASCDIPASPTIPGHSAIRMRRSANSRAMPRTSRMTALFVMQ